MLDVRKREAADGARPHYAAQIPIHQREVRAFHRNIGTGPHRDSDFGLSDRWSIVDAVTGQPRGYSPTIVANKSRPDKYGAAAASVASVGSSGV